jgi:hypothetical protein
MRLSVKKAAHVALGLCRAQEIRGSHVAFRGFLPKKTSPRDLYGIRVIAKPFKKYPLEDAENGFREMLEGKGDNIKGA